ncbi:hypothetical protein [Paraburkholderia sp.]|uniref:hypothetical protein n=1 Tax=Paraburkholderia sp. TaxID=1926495 RepID=UPI002387D24F|nr:hypothetical protein [Paraburkholderia sp.]MDE1181700.1 hypothetical protein [Paraburkholderia sp.]
MPLTTIRVSDTEVQVERSLYSFAQSADADAFEGCIADASVEACYQQHPPVSVRPTMPDEQPDDPNRGGTGGSAITPSLGGMP